MRAAAREVCLHDGKIWNSHMKGPALAEEGATSNSIGYYYRRRLDTFCLGIVAKNKPYLWDRGRIGKDVMDRLF